MACRSDINAICNTWETNKQHRPILSWKESFRPLTKNKKFFYDIKEHGYLNSDKRKWGVGGGWIHTAYSPLKPSLEAIRWTASGAEVNCPVCILCLITWEVKKGKKEGPSKAVQYIEMHVKSYQPLLEHEWEKQQVLLWPPQTTQSSTTITVYKAKLWAIVTNI